LRVDPGAALHCGRRDCFCGRSAPLLARQRGEATVARTLSFSELMQAISDRGRLFVDRMRGGAPLGSASFETLCEMLLSSRGEASGVALASEMLRRWHGADGQRRREFLHTVAEKFGVDHDRLRAAVAGYEAGGDEAAVAALRAAAGSRRLELFRRLNMAPGAMKMLVDMRAAALAEGRGEGPLAAVAADLADLLTSWFNRGFLVLRPIDWSTPAAILEKIVRYEAVHPFRDWEDLRRRVQPGDRRCFAFFHPQLVDEPLIFVEVALTREMSASIDDLLDEDREEIDPADATTAVFYSISNCQDGLRGISFGSFLIKQVVEDLRAELPRLADFVTLSPVPRFAAWLAAQQIERFTLPGDAALALPSIIADEGWPDDRVVAEEAREGLLAMAAHYLIKARGGHNAPLDSVARFHLRNGARLERLNFLGDRSAKALAESHGLMVNYRYKLDDIERNHELFVGNGEVVAAAGVRRLLPAYREPAPEMAAGVAALAPPTAVSRAP
jgi:malonyl-CoA decarboxylase